MMLDSQAPKTFCAEAIRTASYLYTRTPYRVLDRKSPYEMLHKHHRLQLHLTDVTANNEADTDQAEDDKPKLHRLRRFRCIAYRRIPKEQRIDTKMGARSKQCMMLDFHDTPKIWRIWDPEHRKVVNCSDIIFDENQTAYICIGNENDAFGLLQHEPIYAEEHVNLRLHGAPEVSQPSAVESIFEDSRLHAAPGKSQPSAECITGDPTLHAAPRTISGEPMLHDAPRIIQPSADYISGKPRLHDAPRTIQPSADYISGKPRLHAAPGATQLRAEKK
jgi:hypothetical protein